MIDVALVGIGRWGEKLLNEFSQISNIKSCCNQGNEKNLDLVKKHFPSVQQTSNYETILNDSSIKAVVIATPIETHYQLAKAALKSKKHVFVEKPLTTKTSQAKELIDLALSQKVVLFTGYTYLYNEVFLHLTEELADKSLKYAHFDWKKFGSFKEDIIWNLACHTVAIAIKIFKATPVNSERLHVKGVVSGGDVVALRLIFPEDKEVLITINRVSLKKNLTLSFYTEDDWYVWENDELTQFNQTSKAGKKIFTSTESQLTKECKEFINQVEKGQSEVLNPALELDIIQTLEKLKA